MTSLTLRGVTKAFGATEVLRGIDLDVAPQELTAILGPSGCGKTTLLRLVAGFADPDQGTISFGDQVVVGRGRPVPAQRRRVGYVPQEGALFPHLDVAANIAFGLERGARRARHGVVELLEMVGLPASAAQRLPHELSGGQQQRVALARALAPSPKVVLLDEPFASLDAALREGTGLAVREALRRARATGVLVTHDQDEALSLADRVAVMRAGTLVQVGTPSEVYETPADVAVAQFVGAAVLLPATVSGGVARSALGTLVTTGSSLQGRATVLVRPEQIQLQPLDDPAGAGQQTGDRAGAAVGRPARATVTEVRYYGHDSAVRARVHGTELIVTARLLGGPVPAPGTEVDVTVTGPVGVFAAED